MPQIQKQDVRDAMLRSACELLAQRGVQPTSLADIARHAGTSVGNLYKYFPNKRVLLAEAIAPDVQSEALRLIEARFRVLSPASPEPLENPEHGVLRLEAQAFAERHRWALAVLLQGTEPFEAFRDEVHRSMMHGAVSYLRRTSGRKLRAGERRVLEQLYKAFVDSYAALLCAPGTKTTRRDGLVALEHYHLAGLRAFFQRLGR